ncbi:hypothetical protein RRG08_049306 [Elysia crispata]|uniref:Uncharacterized protein n=1 Tax=Elysia crispata TaxID=231223 RepID=A0AAE1E7Q1_9GAST|nr:hypothetical protein RRG08_049306 [Elysia crispata]
MPKLIVILEYFYKELVKQKIRSVEQCKVRKRKKQKPSKSNIVFALTTHGRKYHWARNTFLGKTNIFWENPFIKNDKLFSFVHSYAARITGITNHNTELCLYFLGNHFHKLMRTLCDHFCSFVADDAMPPKRAHSDVGLVTSA